MNIVLLYHKTRKIYIYDKQMKDKLAPQAPETNLQNLKFL
jgi:hypothetical protein